jgi:type IV pilus secretin PilQ/predicted competence protein
MRERHLPKRMVFVIWGALLALLLASPSFVPAQPEKGGPLTVEKIEVAGQGSGSRVAIAGSAPFEYTVFKGNNPVRVIVEMPKAQLGQWAAPLEIRNGTVNVIRSRQTEHGARIEIGLDHSVDYQVLEEGNILFIELAAPPVSVPAEKKAEPPAPTPPTALVAQAPPAPALPEKTVEKPAAPRTMTQIAISDKEDHLEVELKGGEGLTDYRYFQLARPPRLVVDLAKVTNQTSKKLIDVGNPLLKDIRLGQYPEKLRLVFTFPGSQVPPHRVAKNGEGLKVLLGREASKAEEKPVRTAQAAPAPTEKEPVAVPAPPAAVPVAVPAPAPAPEKGNNAGNNERAAGIRVVEGDRTQLTPFRGAKISLDFKDADIHNIFRLIAEVSNLNIITTDEVKGKVTVRLVNVPWDQALDVILTTKNLIKIEEGNVLRITTLDSVRKDREEKQKEEETLLKTRDTKLKLEEPWRKIIKVNYGKAEDIQKLLLEKKDEGKGFLSPQGSVKADKRTNTLIIQDVRNNLEEIEQLIKELDSPTPQVLIEARVVQAQTTFARSLGVQWGGSYNQTAGGKWAWGLTGNNPSAAPGWGFSPGGTTPTGGVIVPSNISMPSNFIVNFPASVANTSVGGMGISFGKLTGSLVNLDLRLQLGETDGQTKVIARPKLATLDNTKAHIKQGELIPYETTSQAGTQVQFIDAVLLLEVTPHVTPDGSIKMSVKVTRDARGSFRTQINQVPSVDKREASTEVLVKDGETIVIGGIYEAETQETTQGIPWLMRLPVLGWLFKNEDTLNVRRELLIFITPTILQGPSES